MIARRLAAAGVSLKGFANPAVAVVVLVSSATALFAAYWVDSPMWLDEALSVNVAGLPLGDIGPALKRDGHPPLYYLLLHAWMAVFGDGDRAVRSMSATLSLGTVPLVWVCARRTIGERAALTAVAVFALSPFVLRYGSEARMYSLVIAEVFAAYLAVTACLDRMTWRRCGAVAIVVAALLWTHYWSIMLVAGFAAVLTVRWVAAFRSGDRLRQRETAQLGGSVVVGGLLFLPWVPVLLYQLQHTGTPWAEAARPSAIVFHTLLSFAGGSYPEPQLFMLLLVVLAVVGATGRVGSHHTIELDVRGTPTGRPLALVSAATLAIAAVVSIVSGSGFSPRYAAVVFPLFVLLVALGLEAVPTGVARSVALLVFVVGSSAGLYIGFTAQRSQSRHAAEAILSVSDRGLVVVCPDQLGPSVARELRTSALDVRSFPNLDAPQFVDWVDYADRNAGVDPDAAARRTIAAAGRRPIFVVARDDLRTIVGKCGAFVAALSRERTPMPLMSAAEAYYEPMDAVAFLIADE